MKSGKSVGVANFLLVARLKCPNGLSSIRALEIGVLQEAVIDENF